MEKPPEEIRSEIDDVRDDLGETLEAARLGADLGFESVDRIWAEMEALAPSHAGLIMSRLGQIEGRDGVVVPVDGQAPAGEPESRVTEAIEARAAQAQSQTAGSDIRPSSQPQGVAPVTGYGEAGAAASAPSGAGARPVLLAWGEHQPAPAEVPPVDAYSLRLVSGRKLYDDGTAVRQSPSLAPLAPGPSLLANPYDLDRLGVSTGQEVKVTSARGSLTTTVRADAAVPRGAVAMAFNQRGDGAADLIDASRPVTEVRVETL